MKRNLGGNDKILRIVGGVILIGLGQAGIGAPWTFIGAVLLVTGLLNWCPDYAQFGIQACKK